MFVCKQEALQGMTIKTYKTQVNLQTPYDDSGRLMSSYAEDEDCIGYTSHFNDSKCMFLFRCKCNIVTIVFHKETVIIVIQGHHAAVLAATTWKYPLMHNIASSYHTHGHVQDAAQATEALQAVHRQQTMWLRTKAAMLANFSRGLRQELAETKSHAAELEVATLHTEVAGLQSMLQQQQDFAHTLAHVCQVSQAHSG